MNKHSMISIILNTHKEFHEVAYCEEQRGTSSVHYGRTASSKVSVKKLLRQFESKYPGATLHVVYEAGSCGFWIYRLIASLGHCCYVVAPLLIPKKPIEKQNYQTPTHAPAGISGCLSHQLHPFFNLKSVGVHNMV